MLMWRAGRPPVEIPADDFGDGQMSDDDNWFLRKGPGLVYGPVPLDGLRAWACDGRVGPGDEVSAGDDVWRPAPDAPELGMDWLLELPDGGFFGPVPLAAFLGMLREGEIAPDFRVRRKDRAEPTRVGDLAAAPPTASRTHLPDEARKIGELRAALGVGRRFAGFGRLRPEKQE